jgi:hypothetical protein
LPGEVRPVSVGGGCTTVFLRQRYDPVPIQWKSRPSSNGTAFFSDDRVIDKVSMSRHLIPLLLDRPTSWSTPDGCWHHRSSPIPYARDVHERRKRLPHVLAKRLGDAEDQVQRHVQQSLPQQERRLSTSSQSSSMPSLRPREAAAALEERLRAIEEIFGPSSQDEVTQSPQRHLSLERLEILARPKQHLAEGSTDDVDTSKPPPRKLKKPPLQEIKKPEKGKHASKKKAIIKEGSTSVEVVPPPLLPAVGLGVSLEKDPLSPSSVAGSSIKSGYSSLKSHRQDSLANTQGYSGTFDDDESEAPSVSRHKTRDLRFLDAESPKESEGYDDFDPESPAKSLAKTKSNISTYSFESDSQVS